MLGYLLFIVFIATLAAITSEKIIHKILEPFMTGPTKDLFKAYHLVFKKDYDLDSEEGVKRYRIFKSNLAFINEENSKQSEYKFGINQFSDMTREEFNQKYDVPEQKMIENMNKLEEISDTFKGKEGFIYTPGAVKVDWTSKMTGPRNQKGCGSCYAFATVAALEGNYNIKTGQSVMFSTQQLVDCDWNANGCIGGNFESKFTNPYGVALESDYPYKGSQQKCRYDFTKGLNITTTVSMCGRACKMDDWIQLLQKGPLYTTVNPKIVGFQSYKGGIIDPIDCHKQGTHSVATVAILNDGDGKGDYIKFKNSWGDNWGENGYGYIRYNAASSTCGLTLGGLLPIVNPNPGPISLPSDLSYFYKECNYQGTPMFYPPPFNDHLKNSYKILKSFKTGGNSVTLFDQDNNAYDFLSDEVCLSTSKNPVAQKIAGKTMKALVIMNQSSAPPEGCVTIYEMSFYQDKIKLICGDSPDTGLNMFASIQFGKGVKCLLLYNSSNYKNPPQKLCASNGLQIRTFYSIKFVDS